MFARKVLASLLSVGLALSMVPMSAVAEELVETKATTEEQVAQTSTETETETSEGTSSENEADSAQSETEVAQSTSDSAQDTSGSEQSTAESVEAETKPVLVELRMNAEKDEDPWVSFESVEKAEELVKQEEQEAADAKKELTKDPVTKLELRLAEAADTDRIELTTVMSEDKTPALLDFSATLSEELAASYDLVYRAHVNGAWLDWVQNGKPAAKDNDVAIDDVQVVLVAKAAEETDEEAAEKEALETEEAAKDEVALQTESETIVAESSVIPVITYSVHAQDYGWMSNKTNGATAGTTGQSKRLEAIKISLPNGTSGGITYQVHAQDYGWMNEVSNGAQAGTTGKSKRLEAIKIRLTGNISNSYDVYYCVHAQDYGWMKWVKNGAQAGTTGKSKRLEAIKITLVPKGGEVPASVVGADTSVKASISYRAATAGMGWLGWMGNGDTAGTTGISGIMEAFCAKLVGLDNSELHYNAHIQNVGWRGEVNGNTTVGSVGSGRRIEAITMRLSGTAAKNYDIYYRCHASNYGWLNWAKNGEKAGTAGLSTPLEAVEVVLVAKNGSAPANDSGRSEAYIGLPVLTYQSHVQNYGWMGWVNNGAVSGTTGKSLRVEGIRANIDETSFSGEIQIKTHVQDYGWRDYVSEGSVSGTTGKSKRLEAMCVRLTGELASNFDVWYRVHAQNVGWMGWAKNGEKAGTQSMSLRLEAVQIKIQPKGQDAPGSTTQAFINGENVTKLGYQNPSGYYQVSSRNVSITSAAYAPWNYVTPSRIGVWASRDDCVNAFIQRAREYLGTPYMWDYSCAPGVGVDCIGLVYQCAYACGMDMGGGTDYDDFNPWAHYITGNSGWHSHDANNFWDYGKAIHVGLDARRPGDVISWYGHVAIYIGDDTMIEAYTGEGVIYSNLWAHGTPRGCIRLFQ